MSNGNQNWGITTSGGPSGQQPTQTAIVPAGHVLPPAPMPGRVYGNRRFPPPVRSPPNGIWGGSPRLQALAPQSGWFGNQPPQEEQAVRESLGDYDRGPAFRQNFPELFIGDFGLAADTYLVDGARLLQGWFTDQSPDSALPQSPDFPGVGNVASMRRIIEVCSALGTHDDTSTPGVQIAATTNFHATFAAGVGLTWGFRLDWAVQNINYAPFDLNIQTLNFVNPAAFGIAPAGIAGAEISVDRTLTLRMRGGTNGGSIFVPWAQRSGQGMNYAMHSLALAFPTSETAPLAEIRVNNVVGAVAPAFGFSVRFLTAWSQSAALAAKFAGTYAPTGLGAEGY